MVRQKIKKLFNHYRACINCSYGGKNRFRWWAGVLFVGRNGLYGLGCQGCEGWWGRCHAFCREYRCFVGIRLLYCWPYQRVERLDWCPHFRQLMVAGYDMLNLGANGKIHQEPCIGMLWWGLTMREKRSWDSKNHVWVLNNGTEASKGEILCAKGSLQLLSEDTSIHFVGNAEARDLMDGVADVVVADGFTGNAVFENDGRNSFWNLEATETSDCYWKLEGETRNFLLRTGWNHWNKPWISQMLEERFYLAFKHLLLKRMVPVMQKQSIVYHSSRFGPC